MAPQHKQRVIVTGGTSGLGLAISDQLEHYDYEVIRLGIDECNLASEESIEQFCDGIIDENLQNSDPRTINILVNCAGVNYIDWMDKIPTDEWDRLMDVNVRSMWLLTKHLRNRELLKNDATILNVVSNASHMPMTHSIAYNASKGAAHILTLQMARELRQVSNTTVFGISPNKLSGTGMSDYIDNRVCELRGWTPEEAAEYQAKSLPIGEETDTNTLAEFIGFLLSTKQRHKYLHGCILPYGA